MKKNKKLLINTGIIGIILFSFYYFGGFYFSKNQCIIETVRALYGNEAEFIMEFQNNHHSVTLMANTDEKSFSLVGTQKFGLLYHSASSFVGEKIDQNHMFDVSGLSTSKQGMVVIAYRNNPSIHRVEVEFDNGDTIILDEWKQNFVGLMIDSKDWQSATYKAYDIHHQLIEERYY